MIFNRENANHLKLMVNSRMVMAGGVFLHYKEPSKQPR